MKRGPKPRKVNVVPLVQCWDPPRGLSSTAKKAFNHAVDLLRQRGNLDRADIELVIAYAQTVEVRDVSYAQLQKDGLFVVSDRNNVSAHPAEKAHAQACMAPEDDRRRAGPDTTNRGGHEEHGERAIRRMERHHQPERRITWIHSQERIS